MPSSIWITLPSNEPNAIGDSGHFTIPLSKPLYFDGKYELALRQISFLNKWNNVFGDGENIFYVKTTHKYKDTANAPYTFEIYVSEIQLPAGYYDSPEYLVDVINELLRNKLKNTRLYDGTKRGKNKHVVLDYEKRTQKITITLLKGVSIIFPSKSSLCTLLGLSTGNTSGAFIFYDVDYGFIDAPNASQTIIKPTTANEYIYVTPLNSTKSIQVSVESDMLNLSDGLKQVTRLCFDMTSWLTVDNYPNLGNVVIDTNIKATHEFISEVELSTINLLYVYCSSIDPIFVGSSEKPLLRIVRVLSEHSEIEQQTFESPFFIPIYTTYLDRLTVKIADHRGNVVNFHGDTVLLLEIRRVL